MVDSYEKLMLGKFLDIIEINAQDIDDTEKMVQIVGMLTGKSAAEIDEMSLAEFSKLSAKVSFINEPMPRPEDYRGKALTIKSLNLGGHEYDVLGDARKMTTAQYVDFQTLVKDVDHNMPALLACVLVPRGHKYGDGYDIGRVVADVLYNLNVVDTARLLAFFLDKWQS